MAFTVGPGSTIVRPPGLEYPPSGGLQERISGLSTAWSSR